MTIRTISFEETATFPRPKQPVFETFEEQRQNRKERLAAAFRLFARYGFEEGVMGHISARDPEYPDRFWLNPFAVPFNKITASSLILTNYQGEKLAGDGFLHPGGLPLHSAILATQPDIVSAVHTHSQFGKVWSATGRTLDPLSHEAAVFYGKHAVYDTLEHGEGQTLAKLLKGKKALLLKNHGLLTVGQTVDEAAYLFISLEKVCREQVFVESLRTDPEAITDERAKAISERNKAYNGWLNFQPLYQSIIDEEPDLLD